MPASALPWPLFLAGLVHADRLEAREALRILGATEEGVSSAFGGVSGERALMRAELLTIAWGDRLPAALRSGTIPNGFGEGGSPADG